MTVNIESCHLFDDLMNPCMWGLGPASAMPILDQPGEGDFPTFLYKHAAWEEVYNNSPLYVKRAMDLFPKTWKVYLQTQHPYMTVDLKVHDLKQGECPCIPGWHLDTQSKENGGAENYCLFVTGESALTQFQNPDGSEFSIPSCTWFGYTAQHKHQGPAALFDEKRLLIRLAFQGYQPPLHKHYCVDEWHVWNNRGKKIR